MGLETAKLLVARGEPLHLVARPSERLEAAQKELEAFGDFHPIGRIGYARDVARAIDFLLSDRAAWISGTVLDVEGGVMAGWN